MVGFAGTVYDAERFEETEDSTAGVYLSSGDTGDTFINSAVSLDGKHHHHRYHLLPHVPETKPYQLALRVDKEGNVPQVQFNDDGVWHDFAPEGRTALNAGPWFPYLQLNEDDCIADHRVDQEYRY
jgi:hypothetical protein